MRVRVCICVSVGCLLLLFPLVWLALVLLLPLRLSIGLWCSPDHHQYHQLHLVTFAQLSEKESQIAEALVATSDLQVCVDEHTLSII